MLPLPLILAIVMAGAVLVIIFLLFQHLGGQKEDLSKHTAEIDILKDDIEQEQAKLKEAAAAENKLRQDLGLSKETAGNLQKELAAKDKLYEELKAKYTQAEKAVLEKKDLTAQLERQKKQFMEQVIKCKKLEKDLHARQDEITALEQRNKKPEEPKKEELKLGDEGRVTKDEGRRTKDEGQETKDEGRVTKDEGQGTKDEGRRTKDEGEKKPEPEKPKEKINQLKQETKDEGRRTRDEGGKKPEPEKPKEEPKKESPFSRFLKPKISEDKSEDSPEGNNKLEQPI